MKKHMVVAVALVAAVAFAAPAWSLSIGSGAIEVGGKDALVGFASLPNAGLASEEAWVESVLHQDVTLTYKLDAMGVWTPVDDQTANNGVFAHELESAPEYFMLKTGNIGGSGQYANFDHFLYDNQESMSYAVVDFAQLGIDFTLTAITKVSHVMEYNGTSVPEPSTLLLLGSGLLGLGLIRRRKHAA